MNVVSAARLVWLVVLLAAAGVSAQPVSFEQAERELQTLPRQVLAVVQQQLDGGSISDPNRARWLAIGSEVAYALALPELALRYAGEGLARPALSAEMQQRLSIAHAQALDLSGRSDESIQLLMTVIATLEHGGFDPQYLIDALNSRATAYYSTSNFRASLADLLRAYPMAPEDGNRVIRADVASSLGNTYAAIEDYGHAERFYLEAIDYSVAAGTWVRASIAEYSLAVVYSRMKQWERSEEFFERSRAHSLLVDDVQGVAYAEYGLAKVALELGRLDKAEQMYRHSHEVFADAGDLLPQANVSFGLARIAFIREQYPQALTHIDDALGLVEKVAELDLKHKLLELQAETRLALGDHQQAYVSLRRAGEARQAFLEGRTSESLAEMRVRFDTERQEQQNALLVKENQLNAARLAEQIQTGRLYIVSVAGLLMILGFLVFLGWRNRAVRHRLAAQALTDELTGIANRRHVMGSLAAEFERARRYRTPLTVAVFDLDHFKRINDRFGHAAGDEVLHGFAMAMTSSLRKSDCFGRIGGEEFMAILPHTDIEVAETVVERMRKTTLGLVCPKLGGKLQPSVSVGIALLGDDDATVDDLVKRADDAVYRAKQAGRNRVCRG